MGQIPNGESFDALSSTTRVSNLGSIFKREMDTVLRGGRSINIDLPAAQTDCPFSCKYNPAYDKYQGLNGSICRDCGGKGFIFEPRYTLYTCNRRWTNEPLDQAENTGEKTTGGRILGNFVRVKTVIDSFQHIEQSIGATIDDEKVKLYKEPRKTGWGSELYYVISWWERINK
jgi:hypothetical protein